jgi:hypothetical protein
VQLQLSLDHAAPKHGAFELVVRYLQRINDREAGGVWQTERLRSSALDILGTATATVCISDSWSRVSRRLPNVPIDLGTEAV